MKRKALGISVVLAAMLLAISAASFAIAGGPKNKSQMFAIGDDGLTTTAENPESVAGGWSMLEREDDAVHAKIRTQVEGGHAYTLWWVVINNPAACEQPPCGEHNIFVDPENHFPDPDNPLAGFRVDQITAAQISVVWGGGAVANQAGRWKLDTTLREGETPGGPAQILIGTGTTDGGTIMPIGVVDGLTDAQEAEFLLLIQHHGPAHDAPDLLEQQLTMFLGACNPVSADPTVFPPDPGSCAEV